MNHKQNQNHNQKNSVDELDELEELVSQFNTENANNNTYGKIPKNLTEVKTEEKTQNIEKNNVRPPAPQERKSVAVHIAPKTNSGCAKCGNKIIGEHILALDRIWHVTCLSCYDCSNPLNGDFYEHEGHHTCKSCMNKKVKCNECGQPITGEYFQGDGKIFHPECLKLPKCAKCSLDIPATTRKVMALGNSYHAQCFNCGNCGKALQGQFYNKGGKPHCEDCSRANIVTDSCFNCKLNITPGTSFIRYEGKVYHETCFSCTSCKKVLPVNNFFNLNSQIVCESCSHK